MQAAGKCFPYFLSVLNIVWGVLSQSNTWLKFLHLLYDLEAIWQKNNKTHFFYVLYSDKTRVYDQLERGCGPIYITITMKMKRKST